MAIGTAGPTSAAIATRRGLVAFIVIGIAVATGVGIYYRSAYPINLASSSGSALSDKVRQGLNGMKTVADMLFGRSPGERAAGALANLKHKRMVAAPHERALPKLRSAPIAPFASFIGLPETPLSPIASAPAEVPLYDIVSSVPPISETPPTTVFPGMSPPPPGGGLIVPPVITQVSVPPPVVPAPVPEPSSWAMMLFGLAFIGRILRRGSGAIPAAV